MTLENILLDLNSNCKLSNFSSYIIQYNSNNKNIIQLDYRYDLQRLGCLVYQMITGKILKLSNQNQFTKENAYTVIDNFDQNGLLNDILPLNSSNEIKEFVAEYLVLKEVSDSKQTTLAIRINPLFSEIDWNKLEKGEIKSPFKVDSVIFIIINLYISDIL